MKKSGFLMVGQSVLPTCCPRIHVAFCAELQTQVSPNASAVIHRVAEEVLHHQAGENRFDVMNRPSVGAKQRNSEMRDGLKHGSTPVFRL